MKLASTLRRLATLAQKENNDKKQHDIGDEGQEIVTGTLEEVP